MKPSRGRLWWARVLSGVWRFRAFQRAERLFGNLTGPCVVGRPFFGYWLWLDVSRSTAHRLLYLEGERFVTERQLARRLMQPGMSVVDVGANVGYYSLMTARAIGPSGRLLAIEPEPDNLRELRLNLEWNRLHTASVLPLALGRSDGKAGLRPGMNGRVELDAGIGLEVGMRSLDSILEGPVDFIKIDVEGFEGEVLAGAEETLRKFRPTIVTEVHPAFLAPPTRVKGIFESLARYPLREIYAPSPQASIPRKIASRYRPGASVRRIQDVPGWLRMCEEGRVEDPFWLVCRVQGSAGRGDRPR